MDLLDVAKIAFSTLNRSGVDYAVAGGLAMGVHGLVRATEDIDVVVASEADARIALAGMERAGWIVNRDSIDFPDGLRLMRALLADGTRMWVLDVLILPNGAGLLHDRIRIDFDGLACWVMSRSSLLTMKRWSERNKDKDDARFLAGET